MNEHVVLRRWITVALGLMLATGCNINMQMQSPDDSNTSDTPQVAADALDDFALPDVNPMSTSFQDSVSPRDYLGDVTAWYFGHST